MGGVADKAQPCVHACRERGARVRGRGRKDSVISLWIHGGEGARPLRAHVCFPPPEACKLWRLCIEHPTLQMYQAGPCSVRCATPTPDIQNWKMAHQSVLSPCTMPLETVKEGLAGVHAFACMTHKLL